MPITFTTARDVPSDAEVLAIPVFANGQQPASASAGVVLDERYLASTGFEGKPGQTQSVLADDGSTIVVVGLGDEASVDLDGLRRAAGCVVRAAKRAKRVATTLLDAAPASIDKAKAAQAIAEGAQMAAYQFTTYKSDSKPVAVETFAVVGRGGATVDRGLARGATIAKAVCMARDWINEPAGAMTPRRLEALARDIAKEGGLAITVLDEKAIIKERLGGLAGVAAGSDEPPRLIELVYNPPGARATVAIVGKGHHLRLGRALAQVGRRNDDDEERHVRRGRRHRHDVDIEGTRTEGEGHRPRRVHREHAKRQSDQAGRRPEDS